MDSLVQQQVHHDIQPQKIATEFKTLVFKHKRSQIITEGDENHNETKRLKLFVLISLKNNTTSAHPNSKNTQRSDCIIHASKGIQ